jgi:hypothetical protein
MTRTKAWSRYGHTRVVALLCSAFVISIIMHPGEAGADGVDVQSDGAGTLQSEASGSLLFRWCIHCAI